MTPIVSVLTPSLPERAGMLAECCRSVESQGPLRVWAHLIEIDEDGDGCAVVMNRLAARAQGEWLLPLADDDLILPGCIDTLVAASDGADVVYAPPLVWGLADQWWFFQAPPAIPSFALVRADLWRELGGYDESLSREEDRDLWTRALAAGARFVRADSAPTWVYRLHAGSKSMAGRQQVAA